MSTFITGGLNIADLEAVAGSATTTRDKCRCLIAVRTGLTILDQKDGDSVAGYFNECKQAHVCVPQKLRAKLDALKETDCDAREDSEEGQGEEDAHDDQDHG